MKILTISDTHGLHNRISKDYFVEADMIIHAGDCSSRGYITEIELFFDWFNQLNYKYKIMIAGNHDFGFQENPDEIKRILLDYPDIIYLEDSFIEIEGIKIYGSPWQPYFHNWAFNLQRGEEIQKKWDLIPKDVNILITHGPVKDILDFVPYNGGEFVGCQNLKETILTLPDLKTHICGHIHCAYGEEFNNGIHYINASCCTERYEPIQKPILFEI
jgi:predicted phosphodiesterase